MSNVTEFSVRDYGLQSSWYFASGWPSFCRNLQRLSLIIALLDIRPLRLESMALCNLENLDLELKFPADATAHATEIILTTIAPFITRSNISLQSLWIRTPLDLDNSPFFDLLGSFPKLHNLDISVGITRNSDFESPITRFVQRHTDTLRSLSYCSPAQIDDPDTEHSLLRVSHIFQFRLLHLRSLTLTLDVYPTTGAALIPCISPFVETLTSIDIRHICLRTNDLAFVTSAFLRSPGTLKSASFGVESLSPELLDSLAQNLSGLENLTLLFSDLGRHGSDEGAPTDDWFAVALREPPFSSAPPRPSSRNINAFHEAFKERLYPDWPLYNISFIHQFFYCASQPAWRVMLGLLLIRRASTFCSIYNDRCCLCSRGPMCSVHQEFHESR